MRKKSSIPNKVRFGVMSIVFIMASAAGFAADVTANGRFKEANTAFEAGDLQTAENIYSELAGQGFQSTALYYNLGNLYYKKGERGKAVLWYERAKRLSPRDSDISFNLSLAQSHMKNEGDPWYEQLAVLFSHKEIAIIMSLFVWTFFVLLGCRFMGWIKDEVFFVPIMWFLGFFMIISVTWFGLNSFVINQPKGVVIVPPGEIRNGPGVDYPVGFTVPEGTRVLILDRRPDWVQVGVTQQGLKGWIPALEVDLISPYSGG